MSKPPPRPRLHRQQYLLAFLDATGPDMGRTRFQKLLFLARHEEHIPHYDFTPWRYGCFSFQAWADLRHLASMGWLQSAPAIRLCVRPGAWLDGRSRDALARLIKRFGQCSTGDLVQYVYERYPWYAIHSQIAERVLSKADYRRVDKERRRWQSSQQAVCTLGYEGLSLESYANKLMEAGVSLLCDVRRNPFSRKFGFSKGALGKLLPKMGIQYLHIPELGIASAQRKSLRTMEDYQKLFRQYRADLPGQADSLRSLADLTGRHGRIALTCYERAPEQCHRHCISDYLASQYDLQVKHL